MITKKPFRAKTCKHCKCRFTPERQFQQACSIECAKRLSITKRENANKLEVVTLKKKTVAEKRKNKVRLDELRPLGYYVKKTQAAINKWIVHVRDKGKPCISCGQHKDRYDAGHYLARSTHPELRFEELNIYRQCVYCNNYSKNSHHAYRAALIKKIGIEKVERLESKHKPKHYSIDDLKALERVYKDKYKEAMKCSQD